MLLFQAGSWFVEWIKLIKNECHAPAFEVKIKKITLHDFLHIILRIYNLKKKNIETKP